MAPPGQRDLRQRLYKHALCGLLTEPVVMHPYWVRFRTPPEMRFGLGVGVTAYSETDARDLLAEMIGAGHEIASIEVIKDLAQLDQSHVIPNMGNFFMRGIWFPLGYHRPRR